MFVVWGGEFGCMLMSEKGNGWDYNLYGFIMWMVGGGVVGGCVIGEMDELGFYVILDCFYIYDLYVMIFYVLGFDLR